MKFLVFIQRCGGHEQFNARSERACDVLSLSMLKNCHHETDPENPPEHLWVVHLHGEKHGVLGWLPRFVECEMLVAEIERLERVCDEWRKQYKDDEA